MFSRRRKCEYVEDLHQREPSICYDEIDPTLKKFVWFRSLYGPIEVVGLKENLVGRDESVEAISRCWIQNYNNLVW